MFIALTSGVKTAFFLTLLFLMCAYISKEQKPPFGWLLAAVLVFLVAVEPFVAQGRRIAEELEVTTSQERRSVFSELISSPEDVLRIDLGSLNITTLFRGISAVGGEIARRSSMFDGTWDVDTLAWGLKAQIPRVLADDKPDLNIGNYIARTTGTDMGLLMAGDDVTNISPSVPFEVVGNYGWVAGTAAFFVLGLLWAGINVFVLSRPRLETHPLTPLFVSLALFFEAPFGHFLASLKAFLIPLAVLVLWSICVRRHL